MSRTPAIFLALVLFATHAFAGVNSWTTAGPQGGTFRDIEQPNGTQAFSFSATANTAGTNVANASVVGVSGAAEVDATTTQPRAQ